MIKGTKRTMKYIIQVEKKAQVRVYYEVAENYFPTKFKLSLIGRWTREEHHLFVKGLELHGKGWKRIAEMIKTRTVVQIRTHAQKYFLKLSKARQGNNNIHEKGLADDENLYEDGTERKVSYTLEHANT